MNSYGTDLKITIFGQSHSKAIGVVMDGLPSGEKIDFEQLQKFLNRRAPGKNIYSTKRKESDIPEFISGLKENITCGTPLMAMIYNNDMRSSDYKMFKEIPRPGHTDYTAFLKYGENSDFAGGGHFSGRLTAALCIAGGVCLQILERHRISIISRIASIGGIEDLMPLKISTAQKEFPVVNDEIGQLMLKKISEARACGDSVGGIIECIANGIPGGLGEHIFGGIENRISQIIFGIPAIKGIEFGDGFKLAQMFGSESNDEFRIQDNKIVTKTNHCGGVLGGITNGMPLVFRVAIKPTPSIAKEQESINIKTMENVRIKIGGRHDPCIVPRAVPCVETAAAIAIYDAFLAAKKNI